MSSQPLEFAYMADGRVCIGWSNQTEAGGFTIVGDVSKAVRDLLERAAKVAENEPELPGDMPAIIADAINTSPAEAMRAGVRATKKNIAASIRALSKQAPGE